jgi:hypothetical protein
MTDAAAVGHSKSPKTGPTELYRHFDAKGVLLYVGISLSAVERLRQHRAAFNWFGQIVRVDIEVFPSRKEAVAAERRAVKAENPKYNTAAATIVMTLTGLGRAKKFRLPADFGPIPALPINLFAEADGSHRSTIIRRIKSGELETIPPWSPHRTCARLWVRLTDIHREAFQARAALPRAPTADKAA